MYRDKISVEAEGRTWREETSPAKDFVVPVVEKVDPVAMPTRATTDSVAKGRFLSMPFRSSRNNKPKGGDDNKYQGFGNTGVGGQGGRNTGGGSGGQDRFSSVSSFHQKASRLGEIGQKAPRLGEIGGGGTMQGTLRDFTKTAVMRSWSSIQSYFGYE